ncbi:glycoside hydrolase family 53 protein [Sedimentisphaera salicampi]|uniref:Arabinogalactan endo-beta-1,4-galactanase n=1 Tax=Sedimentisphaera salicampi TaxID=1941349 RepID=A0A1W6LLH7_9BACT|nr:glycosyl hydrolase 53 family protein [Sedimentisphaera salicampi]ARN56606.1 Arabinogalactan endo-1,4-beta-galactosidase precursor [Sedimentisphaera salicampi]
MFSKAAIFLTSVFLSVLCPAEEKVEGEFYYGADISALAKIEQMGGEFKSDGQPADPIELFTQNGWNCARLRLFVNPNHKGAVVNDLEYTLKLAERAKTAGMDLLLDLHYSDTWADPGHQRKPAEWKNLDFYRLREKVESYTARVIKSFCDKGICPEMVQIGNEINPGFLWPEGKIEWKNEKSWLRFAHLIKAGIRGVRKASPEGKRIKTVIHTALGGNVSATKTFFDHMEKYRVDYDVIAQSCYPWWHGTLEEIGKNLEFMADRYDKEIIIAETAYPHKEKFSQGKGDWTEERMAWPMNEKGQAQFLKELTKTAKSTPNGKCIGIFYWYPESINVKGMHTWMNGAMALFDKDGLPLKALKAPMKQK